MFKRIWKLGDLIHGGWLRAITGRKKLWFHKIL
jgi:hypothetical protein